MTTFVKRFLDQVALNPDARAVTFGDETISYAELSMRSDALAVQIAAQGAKPETIVGVALPRSIDLVVALLAVLKTGAAYMPLDPDYPKDRLAYLIADAQPVGLVTAQGVEIPANAVPVVDVSTMFCAPSPRAADSLQRLREDLSGQTAAYVIYTSGSTGSPKGVVVSHDAFLGLLDVTIPEFDLGDQDVWSVFHSYAFDFSVWEIWAPLLTGARAVIVPREATWSATEFLHLLEREKVTVLNQTPTAFAAVAQADAECNCALEALRLVIFGGEALEPARLRDWFSRRPDRPRMVNMYGITETTVHVTAFDMHPDHRRLSGASPIGKPLAGFRSHVLDHEMRAVAADAGGELYLAGRQLARGYLRRPSLTATRFIADPDGGGGRLYRTGDLVRRTSSGLAFKGRADLQLSLRGFRIEPGEIEAVLEAFPGVTASAVTIKPDPDGAVGEACLVAYVTFSQTVRETRELRAHLNQALPAHLVPTHIVVLKALPLTPNNKLDRAALPAPSSRQTTATTLDRSALLRRRASRGSAPTKETSS